jgi:iron-sulfur cluster assembly accessory protein
MKRDILTVTDSAKTYINGRCDGGRYLVSVKINNKGCSGHSYEYSLIEPSQVHPMDEVITWSGGGLAISSLSVMYVIGSTLDVNQSVMEQYLVWNNPNAVDTCGCGVSFSLND